MTAGAVLGMLGALCVVLAVIAVAARAYLGLAPKPSDGIPLRVLGRVALGARQGMAAVQVGDRVLVVSVGDGGVRTLLELDEPPAELAEPLPTAESWAAAVRAGAASRSWQPVGRLLRRLGSAAALVLLLGGVVGALALAPATALAQATQAGAPAVPDDALSALGQALPSMQLQVGDDDGLRLSGTVGTVLVIGLLALLPTLLLLMTSFTRVLIVLHFLRQALGTQTAPPTQMLAALALLLTGFIMAPTLAQMNDVAIKPWMDGQMDEAQMMSAAAGPMRDFMASHVRESDLATFLEMSAGPMPESIDDVPLVTLVSAFAISELRTAFQIGFVLFLPFLVIDLVVAAILMSLGMFMLPPVMVSLPFKLLLFVLVDGWSLIVHSIVASFG